MGNSSGKLNTKRHRLKDAAKRLQFRRIEDFIKVLECFPVEIHVFFRRSWRKGRPISYNSQEKMMFRTSKRMKKNGKYLKFKVMLDDLYLDTLEIKLLKKLKIHNLPYIDICRVAAIERNKPEFIESKKMEELIKSEQLVRLSNTDIEYQDSNRLVIKDGVTMKLSPLRYSVFKVYVDKTSKYLSNRINSSSLSQDAAIRRARKLLNKENKYSTYKYRLSQVFRDEKNNAYIRLFISTNENNDKYRLNYNTLTP